MYLVSSIVAFISLSPKSVVFIKKKHFWGSLFSVNNVTILERFPRKKWSVIKVIHYGIVMYQ